MRLRVTNKMYYLLMPCRLKHTSQAWRFMPELKVTELPQVQSQPELHNELQANLGYQVLQTKRKPKSDRMHE